MARLSASVEDPAARKAISDEIKVLISSARTKSGSSRPFTADYSEMKLAYCATNPPGSKVLCSTAASRYSGAPGGPRLPSPAGAPHPSASSAAAMEWYCAKPSAEPQACKRVELVTKLRATVAVEEKKRISAQLKQYPSMPYGTTQANHIRGLSIHCSSPPHNIPSVSRMVHMVPCRHQVNHPARPIHTIACNLPTHQHPHPPHRPSTRTSVSSRRTLRCRSAIPCRGLPNLKRCRNGIVSSQAMRMVFGASIPPSARSGRNSPKKPRNASRSFQR